MRTKFRILFFFEAALLCHLINAEYTERKQNLPITPRALLPQRYELFFQVDMEDINNFFTGVTVIKAECIISTNEIILNVKNLIIVEESIKVNLLKHSATDTPTPRDPIPLKTLPQQEDDKDAERYKIKLEKKLEKSNVIRIEIKYSKPIHVTDDSAFIRYSYRRTEDSKTELVGITPSGAINSRQLFPCIDEIDLKQDIAIGLKATLIKHENKFQQRNDEAEVLNHSSLATFLLGFVIGEFDLISSEDAQVHIWVKEKHIVEGQMKFASDTVEQIHKFFSEYFHVNPPETRINLITLPHYRRVDKWKYGQIVMDESSIMNENSQNEVEQMEIVLQLCDMLSHQYFWLKTTLSTWTENWLTMGLALYFRIPGVFHIIKEKAPSLANTKLVESFIRIMDIDAEAKSRPLMLADKFIDLNNLFEDSMLAETAHFYVRMMSYILGNEKLHEGVSKYLSEQESKITTLDQVWNLFPFELDVNLSSKSLKDIMDSWMIKKGHPRIEVTRDSQHKLITIKQKLPEGDNNPRIISLSFKTLSVTNFDSEQHFQIWLTSTDAIQKFLDNSMWIVLDMELDILCRMEYDETTIKLLQETLLDKNNYEKIGVMSRTQLMSDMFISAWMGQRIYSLIIPTMEYLIHEESHLPMMVASHELIKIRSALIRTPSFDPFQKYMQKILVKLFQKDEYSNIGALSYNKYEDYYKKKLVIKTSCIFGVESCVKQSIEIFNKWMHSVLTSTNDPIPDGIREVVYCQVIKESTTSEEWNFLLANSSPKNMNDILNAFGCSSDEAKLKKCLELSLNTEKLDNAEWRLTAFRSVASNHIGYPIAMDFLKNNFNYILAITKILRVSSSEFHAPKRNEKTQSTVHRYFEILYENTWRQEDLDQLNSFVKSNKDKLKSIKTHLAESKDKAARNIRWLTDNGKNFTDYFQ